MADKPYQLRYLPMWKRQFTNDWKIRYLLKIIVLPENENMTTTEFMLETTPFIML